MENDIRPIENEDNDKITLIVILSLAFSGTTWFTLVLSSHPDTINLGAGDTIFDEGPKNPENLCLVHREKCPFWPAFFKTYNSHTNFLEQLCAFTGKRVFVINNPKPNTLRMLATSDAVDLKIIKFIRDGRAALASAMRHLPQFTDSVYQAALAWVYRGTRNLERRCSMEKNILSLRYEDAVEDPTKILKKVSGFTGVTYTSRSLQYWNYPHHPANANSGVMDNLIQLQGGTGLHHHRKAYYDKLKKHLEETGGMPLLDESWKSYYEDDIDKAAYDFAAGKLYHIYGYERFQISKAAQQAFQMKYKPPQTPEMAEKTIGPWRR